MDFDKLILNGETYPATPGEAPKVFTDKWLFSYGVIITLKSRDDFEKLVKSVNEHSPSVFIYQLGDDPMSSCLQRRGIVQRIEVIGSGPNFVRVHIIYTLQEGAQMRAVRESER